MSTPKLFEIGNQVRALVTKRFRPTLWHKAGGTYTVTEDSLHYYRAHPDKYVLVPANE